MAWICHEIASYLTLREKANWVGVILICQQGMEKNPRDMILPMLLSNLYAESGYYINAMQTEDRFARECAKNTLVHFESALFGFNARVLSLNSSHLQDITILMRE